MLPIRNEDLRMSYLIPLHLEHLKAGGSSPHTLAKREHVSDKPLTAMTSGPAGATTANAAAFDFLVADLDGQLTDEMVVFGAGAVMIYSAD